MMADAPGSGIEFHHVWVAVFHIDMYIHMYVQYRVHTLYIFLAHNTYSYSHTTVSLKA